MGFAPTGDAMIVALEEGKTMGAERSRALTLIHCVTLVMAVLNTAVDNEDASDD
jgi:hypothetical protein